MIDWLSPRGGSLMLAVATACAGLAGGAVRGYSGFGFALAAIPLLTLFLPPATAVPAVLPIEVGIGLATIPAIQGDIARPALFGLVAGTLIGTPLGLIFLASLSPDWMRLVIGTAIVVAVTVVWWRPAFSAGPMGFAPLAGAGFVSGLLNGGTALSGPPAIVALLGSGLSGSSTRSTIMAFVAFSAALGIAIAASNGLYSSGALGASLVMAPAAATGALIGNALFRKLPKLTIELPASSF
ncbi:putative membrane protein YfcA [Bradyrhizobium sp. USDA 4509]